MKAITFSYLSYILHKCEAVTAKSIKIQESLFLRQTACLPIEVLPAVLPSWFFWKEVPGPSFPGPSSSPSHLVFPGGGGNQALLPRSFQQSFPSGLSEGVPCDLSYNALDVTCLLSRHKLMGVASCSCLYTAGTPPPHSLTDLQTCLKTLPSRKLRMWAVINNM